MFLDAFISAGSEFHSFGAEFWNDLFPYFTLLVLGMVTDGNLRSTWLPDLRDLEGV